LALSGARDVADGQSIGRVGELWRFPVKSMAGERLDVAEFTEAGTVGDRAYALVDSETGKVVSAKNVRQFAQVLQCRAAFIGTPAPSGPAPPVRITLPDGAEVTNENGEAEGALSALFGREVRLARAAPDDFTIDQHHPDVEGADPSGHRDVTVQQKLGAAFFAQAGMPSPIPPGSFFDLFPMSVITTSTLRWLSQLQPSSRFEPARFRMNIVVSTSGEGPLENAWQGRALAAGPGARLQITMPDPRCVMTTLAQDGLPQDLDVLRTLVAHSSIDVVGRPYPCAGVYAVVTSPGAVRVGEAVDLI
jgi:uncharacterized protein YcbX